MIHTIKTIPIAAALAIALTAITAHAAEMTIEFTGLNLSYDGSDITDAEDAAGGGGDPALSDELTSMVFSVDGSVVGTLTSDIYADIAIPSVAIPSAPGVSSSAGGGIFDLLTSSSTPGFGLALDLASFDITYTGFSIAVFGNGVATEAAQDLPFGLALAPGDTVTVSFSTQIDTIVEGPDFVESFTSSGTGEVSAEAVPEPSSLFVTFLGLLGLSMVGLRYRWG